MSTFFKVVASGGVSYRTKRGGHDHAPDTSKLDYGTVLEAKEVVKGWARIERRKWLPIKKDGAKILRELQNPKKLFRITADNGVAYRNTKNKHDRVTSRRGPEKGDIMEASEVFNGWIRVHAGYYVPIGLGSGIERMTVKVKSRSKRSKREKEKKSRHKDSGEEESGLKTSHGDKNKKKKKKKEKTSGSDSESSESSSGSSEAPRKKKKKDAAMTYLEKKARDEKRKEERFWGKSKSKNKKRSSKSGKSDRRSPKVELGDSDEDFEVAGGGAPSLPSSPVQTKKKKKKSRHRSRRHSDSSASASRSTSPPKKALPQKPAPAAPAPAPIMDNLLDFGTGAPSQPAVPAVAVPTAPPEPKAKSRGVGSLFGSGGSDSESESEVPKPRAVSSAPTTQAAPTPPAPAADDTGIMGFLATIGNSQPEPAKAVAPAPQFSIDSVLYQEPVKPQQQAQNAGPLLDLFAPAPSSNPPVKVSLQSRLAASPQSRHLAQQPMPTGGQWQFGMQQQAGSPQGMPPQFGYAGGAPMAGSPQAGMVPGMNPMRMQHKPAPSFAQSPGGSTRKRSSGPSFPSPSRLSSKVTMKPALNDRKREGEKKALESWEDVFKNSLDTLHLGHAPTPFGAGGRKRSNNVKGWKVGDIAMRKGQMCTIVKIDESTRPPSATVRMQGTNTEANTELHLLAFARKDQPSLSCMTGGHVSLTGIG